MLAPAAGDAEHRAGRATPQLARDDGYWLLPLVMLFALPLFRRGGGLALCLLLALGMPMAPVQAQAPSTADGGWWRRADQQAYARMQSGIADYRKGRLRSGDRQVRRQSQRRRPVQPRQCLAKAGRYDEAIAAYDRALR